MTPAHRQGHRSTSDQDELDELIEQIANNFEMDLASYASAFEDRAAAELAEVGIHGPGYLADALRRGAVASARDALARLRTRAPLPEELPADMARVAHLSALVDQGLVSAAAARLAWDEVFWECFADAAESVAEDPQLRWEAFRASHDRLRGYGQRLGELFRRTHDREAVTQDADGRSQVTLVARALNGQPVDPHALRYDVDGKHVAVVCDCVSADTLVSVARSTDTKVLRVAGPDGEVWAWLGGEIPVSRLDALAGSHREPGICLALGEPATGLAGFRASHNQALEAWSVARALGDPVVRYADIALLLAILHDRDLSAILIRRELGPLADASPRARDLRAVARAYLEHGQNTVATASHLGCNRRTVERKVEEVELLVGHLLRQRTAEFLVALRLADLTVAGS